MSKESTVTVSQAQAQLPKLLKKDSFAISRHGKIVGVYLSRDRIEAMLETMELLGDSGFMKALKEYKTGKMKFVDLKAVR
jgi:PHD/YefM family antitoxin component YafN of YafNO toxin-antitoxin module